MSKEDAQWRITTTFFENEEIETSVGYEGWGNIHVDSECVRRKKND